MQLIPEMTYRVRTTDPLDPTQGAPGGTVQYWRVSEAELTGDRINARLAAPGMDWMAMSADGYWRPDVRAAFRTDDGAVVLMHYTGLVEQTEAFKAAATTDRPTGWDDQYMRLALRFETGDPRYAWLTTALFVARGRLIGTGRIEYEVCRVG